MSEFQWYQDQVEKGKIGWFEPTKHSQQHWGEQQRDDVAHAASLHGGGAAVAAVAA